MALDSHGSIIYQHVVDQFAINVALHMQWLKVIHVVCWLLENSTPRGKAILISRSPPTPTGTKKGTESTEGISAAAGTMRVGLADLESARPTCTVARGATPGEVGLADLARDRGSRLSRLRNWLSQL